MSERLESQAAECAKDKAALQEQVNEHTDRLVTMSDDHRQADRARRDAEQAATTAHEKILAAAQAQERLERELVDARDEVRQLTETLGETHRKLDTVRRSHAARLAERDAQLEASKEALEEAQALVRQYVDTDRSLVQALIDERRAASQ